MYLPNVILFSDKKRSEKEKEINERHKLLQIRKNLTNVKIRSNSDAENKNQGSKVMKLPEGGKSVRLKERLERDVQKQIEDEKMRKEEDEVASRDKVLAIGNEKK